ncbi:MAG: hypothetical protein U1E27_07040, partial [Kiritimatiellia bacterium]|nr:hypothetical protein [Kiritimatiellia bacterium]
MRPLPNNLLRAEPPSGGTDKKAASSPAPPPGWIPDGERWFHQHRDRLWMAGRALDGREPGRQDPAEFHDATTRILFCRLSPYEDVRPSLSHRMLYWAARQIPGVYADLAFFPTAHDAAFLKKHRVPFWLASGCKQPPSAFDILAITLSVAQEAFNLPAALRDSGLQWSREARQSDPAHPLVLLGGQGAGTVPFLHDMIDAVVLGDGIGWLQTLLQSFDPTTRRSLPVSLQTQPGGYIPSHYRHDYEQGLLKKITPLHPDTPYPVRFRSEESSTWIDGYDGAYIPFCQEDAEETLPLAFGCVYRCRFCQTGWTRKGLDAAARDDLRRAALRLKTAMAASDLNLLASDACSVPDLDGIVRDLLPLFPKVSLKSLAITSLLREPGAVNLLDKREFAFGLEGISRRLRAYLGKNLDIEDLIAIVRSRGDSLFRQIKLFFIATGLETEDDMEELHTFLRDLQAATPGCRKIASFMPLFHAPFTPLQFEAFRPLTADLRRELESAVEHTDTEFRWSASPDEIALMNRLCRAGRDAAPLLIN